MIICCGDTTKIKTDQWHVMELRSERTAEEILKRVLMALKATFRGDPVEVFVPERRTRENSFSLMTDSYVFVWADDPAKVGKLRKITGVQGMISKDDSTRISSFLTVGNDYVTELKEKVMAAYYARGAAIKVNSWVKILDSQDRDLYGHVVSLADGRACVRVDLKTKLWFVDTSVYNLLDCSDIDPRFRVYYYGPSVERMIDENPEEAAELLKRDLAYDENAVRAWLYGEDSDAPAPLSAEEAIKTSRERTPSRFARSLILSGERDVHALLAKVVEAIRQGHLRCPKTTTILWHIIRTELLQHAFPGEGLVTYTDLVKLHGARYNLVPADVALAFPELASAEDVAELVPVGPLFYNTTSSFTRAHLTGGRRNLLSLVAQLQSGLKRGIIRAPKHLHSLVQAMRVQVLRYFRERYPGASFAEIVAKEGSGLSITLAMVQEQFPDLNALVVATRANQQQVRPRRNIA
jgi:hypothetical protein